MKTKCPRLPPSPSLARSFCNYMQLPFVILCKQCLQHTNARSRRSNTTTNEWTKRTTTAQNDCEKCFTHVKCTACPTTTIPFIRCQFADAIARESMWYVNICHTLIERYIECGIHLFFHLLLAVRFTCVRHQVNAKHHEIKIQRLNRM